MWYLFLRTDETDVRTGGYRIDIVGPFNSVKAVDGWMGKIATHRSPLYHILCVARWDATIQNPETMERWQHLNIH